MQTNKNNYLESFKNTEMYNLMSDWLPKRELDSDLSENVIEYQAREELKLKANLVAKFWLIDWAIVMKDIAHWHRYLEWNPKDPMDFFGYVEFKYTNENLDTY